MILSNALASDTNTSVVCDRVVNCYTNVQNWSENNGLTINKSKTATLIFKRNCTLENLLANNDIQTEESAKFLGVILDSKLTFNEHVDMVAKKVSSGIYALKVLRDVLPKKELVSVYHALIGSHLTYGILAWGLTSKHNMERLLRLQKWAIRTMLSQTRITSCRNRFRELEILTFPCLYAFHACIHLHKLKLAGELKDNSVVHGYYTRHSNDIHIGHRQYHKTKTTLYSDGIRMYNKLPDNIRQNSSLPSFRVAVKKYFLSVEAYDYEDLL